MENTVNNTVQAPLTSANAFRLLGNERQRDARTVVISWPSVPVEIIHAAGFECVLVNGSAEPTPLADRHVEHELFPARLRQLIEAALASRLAHIAALVIPRSSEPDYRAYQCLRDLERHRIGGPYPPMFLLDLQHADGAAIAHDRDRLAELYLSLAPLGSEGPDCEGLAFAIRRANRARAAGRRLLRLRANAPRLWGREAMHALTAFYNLPPERFVAFADTAVAKGNARVPATGTCVLLAGAPLDSGALHAAIESRHVTVTDEITPFGTDAVRDDVLPAPDPLLALAVRYRSAPGNTRTPTQVAMQRFESALAHVDAVVIVLPEDDPAAWDYPRLRARLERSNLPHAVVTTDAAGGFTAAALEPVTALLDSLHQARMSRHG